MNSEKRQPLFIVGMPCSGLPWLSHCFWYAGAVILDQGMYDHPNFDSWASEIDSHLGKRVAGDAGATLIAWLPEILARWPRARFVVILRDEAAGLAEFLRDSPRCLQEHKRNAWANYLPQFHAACDRLRREEADYRFFKYEDLLEPTEAKAMKGIMEYACDWTPDHLWVLRWMRVRVTSYADCIGEPFPMAALSTPASSSDN